MIVSSLMKVFNVYEVRDMAPSYIGYVEAETYKEALSIAKNEYGANIIVEE